MLLLVQSVLHDTICHRKSARGPPPQAVKETARWNLQYDDGYARECVQVRRQMRCPANLQAAQLIVVRGNSKTVPCLVSCKYVASADNMGEVSAMQYSPFLGRSKGLGLTKRLHSPLLLMRLLPAAWKGLPGQMQQSQRSEQTCGGGGISQCSGHVEGLVCSCKTFEGTIQNCHVHSAASSK